MYEVGGFVVYKKDVCKIEEVKRSYMDNKDYYVLRPVIDQSLKIVLPVDSNCLRSLITKDEVNELISRIPTITIVDRKVRKLDIEYRNLMSSGRTEDLIKIIKTTYERNKERINKNRKIGDIDSNYFSMAEKYLYNEISVTLGISYEETKKYIFSEVEKII